MTYQTELQSLVHEDNTKEDRVTNKTYAVGGVVLLMLAAVFFLAGQSSGANACFKGCMGSCHVSKKYCYNSCKYVCQAKY